MDDGNYNPNVAGFLALIITAGAAIVAVVYAARLLGL